MQVSMLMERRRQAADGATVATSHDMLSSRTDVSGCRGDLEHRMTEGQRCGVRASERTSRNDGFSSGGDKTSTCSR